MTKVLLFSDIHYTTEKSADELRLEFPNAIASVASGLSFGFTQEQKINEAKNDILAEHERSALDSVLMLGDISIDDYDFRQLPINYCAEFKRRVFDALPCDVHAIPGNHDSYPDEIWREVFGCGRQFYFELGGFGFIMADTFSSEPATGASGSKYVSLDVDFVKKILAEHPEKRFFICTHYLSKDRDSDEVLELLADERIVCVFRGHTHIHGVVEMKNGKKIVDIGGYGYNGMRTDYGYEFNNFDESWAWGYELLEFDENEIRISHVTTERTYNAKNGCFNIEKKVEEMLLAH